MDINGPPDYANNQILNDLDQPNAQHHAANRTLLARHAVNALPICNGTPNSVNNFIRSLRHIAANVRPDEENNFLILIGSRLTGIASDHYFRRLANYHDVEALINDFRVRFSDTSNTALLLSNIRNEKMHANDTVSTFADRVEAAMSRAKSHIENNDALNANEVETLINLIDTTTLQHFLDSLKPEIEIRTKILNPNTISTAISAALEIENTLLQNQTQNSYTLPNIQNLTITKRKQNCLIHGNCGHSTDTCRQLTATLSQTNQRNQTQNNFPNPGKPNNYSRPSNYQPNNYNRQNNYQPNTYNRNNNYQANTFPQNNQTNFRNQNFPNRNYERQPRPQNNFPQRQSYPNTYPTNYPRQNNYNQGNYNQNYRPNNPNYFQNNRPQTNQQPRNTYTPNNYQNQNNQAWQGTQNPPRNTQPQQSMLNPPYMQEGRNQRNMNQTTAAPKNEETARPTVGPTTQPLSQI